MERTEKIKVLSDSTCDLTPEEVEALGIELIPVEIILGTDVYLDGEGINARRVLEYTKKTGQLPKTAATNTERFKSYFKKYQDQGYKVIHFNISSKASGMHANAVAAAKELGGDIFVVDSMALSSGQGLLIMKTCDYIREGKSYAEICEILKTLPQKVQTSFVVDTLEFLHKGGRCSLAAMMGAKILKLHPYISMIDGQLKAKKKYAGTMQKCLTSYVKDLAAEYAKYDDTRCFITHSPSDPALVEIVKSLAKELFNFKEVLESEAGSTVTSHCGENTVGLLFITE
ncbi:MAG: DegV family protein [Clostridia bacterium]|nr:DegV family protein [Clostridia bacterium]